MKKTILIFLAFILFACGARKSDITKKEETLKTDFSGFFRNSGNSESLLKTDLNLKRNYLFNWSDNSKTTSEEFKLEPDDPTKPSSFTMPNGQKYIFENAKLTSKNSKQENDIKKENSGNSEEILKTDHSKKAKQLSEAQIKQKAEAYLVEKNKKIEREKWSYWNILWLLIAVLIILAAWKLWEKYKKVNPAV
ncbi:MAG: hypothetical protein ABI441_10930 [Flavobacterium sp.]